MTKNKKTIYGQFFTKDNLWLKPQILNFIRNSKCETAYDPFAGGGHLLDVATKLGFSKTIGLDIDGNLGWKINDSLISIPHIDEKTIIITNPPYLSNYSASRKGIMNDVKKYFAGSSYDDLYLIALDNMLESQNYVVAIIPETFINSNFRKKNYLHSITILEESLFEDTDTPVVVACFDGKLKDLDRVEVFKNEVRVNDLASIEKMRLIPQKDVKMDFNHIDGWLAVRCVDTTNPQDMLKFDYKSNIKYNWKKGIKVSSRLLTLVKIDVPLHKRDEVIAECNQILNSLRQETSDIVLSPFKGNMKNGRRRRRLDFKTCRAIIEKAYQRVLNEDKGG